MTHNTNTNLSHCQQVSAEANKNWNLSQLYQHIESIKLQQQKEPLTPLEKICLEGLFFGYTAEMISQELPENLDYYLVQITFWTLYRYIKTITSRNGKEITNYQDVIDSLEASGYKFENADTILLSANNTASLAHSQIVPQTLQHKQNVLPQVIDLTSTSDSVVVLPKPSAKRLASLNMRLLILLLSGLLVFLFTSPGRKLVSKLPIISTLQSEPAATAQDYSSTTILPVETTKVNLVESYQVDRTYTGTIVSRRSSSLGFELGGKLLNLTVDRGQQVEVGTILAVLDTKNLKAKQKELLAERKQVNALLEELQAGPRSETIAAAQSIVNSLHSQLKLAQIKGQRRQELHNFGAISREQLEEATTEVNILQARLNEAQSKLDELLAGTRPEKIAAQQALLEQLDAKLASLEVELEQSTLKAPFSGKIAKRLVDEGTVVSAGESIFTLVESSTLEVQIGVPVNAASQIPLGSNQQIQIGSKTYQTQVLSTLPQLDSTTRTIIVVLGLPQSATSTVRAGQVARLKLSQTIADSGYWLPTTALTKGARGLWSCYVLGNPKNVDNNPKKAFFVEQRELEVLQTENERVFVRSTFKNNDRVIVNGNHRLVNGQLVRPVAVTD